jgi:pimeloyl-ACP methyl ester carboxylesterase
MRALVGIFTLVDLVEDSLPITARSARHGHGLCGQALRLAGRFTVDATDLAGYGASLRPAGAPDHAPRFMRALAADHVQAMATLGRERFAVAGHDRAAVSPTGWLSSYILAGIVRMEITECACGPAEARS